MDNKSGFPLVSVLMPAYNRQAFIAEAIESVLKSTYSNFELIIVDDHSSDDTLQIANEFAAKDKRIKVYHNEKNLDQFPNRNKAASKVTGELIFCADSDDTIEPDALAYVVKQFNDHPQINFAMMYLHGDIDGPTVLDAKTSIRRDFFEKKFLVIGPAGTIIRTEYFRSIGGFPEAYGPTGDMYYNLKAASNTSMLLLPYVFFKYRRHEGQEINKKYSYLYNNYRYFRDAMKLPELALTQKERNKLLAESRRKFLFYCLMHIRRTGKVGETLRAFKLAQFGFKEIVSGIFKL